MKSRTRKKSGMAEAGFLAEVPADQGDQMQGKRKEVPEVFSRQVNSSSWASGKGFWVDPLPRHGFGLRMVKTR